MVISGVTRLGMPLGSLILPLDATSPNGPRDKLEPGRRNYHLNQLIKVPDTMP